MICLDASLALKLLVVEEDSARARSLWRSWIAAGVEVVAPGLFVLLFNAAHEKKPWLHHLGEHEPSSTPGA
jgi:predicted nucleic acid-binding protein